MKNSAELLKISDRFGQVKVLVVGDVMLDRYWWGNASRLSPEAPVPVVALRKVSNVPGGAANVAANIAGFGATVLLASVVGADDSANCLCEALTKNGIATDHLLASKNRPTTTKTRVLVHNQQIARVDDETTAPLDQIDEANLTAALKQLISEANLIVLSDYAKGCLTKTLISSVIAEARTQGKMVLVDPKGKDFIRYKGATLLTPNLSEAVNAVGIEHSDENSIEQAAAAILSEVEIDSLLITLGEDGMKLFDRQNAARHFPSTARQVFDVTGAGDAVIATLAVALAVGADVYSAISLANFVAGLSVEKVGTSIIKLAELRAALENDLSHSS